MKNKIIVIIIFLITLTSCHNNRFDKREASQILTFGFYPKQNECDKLDVTKSVAPYRNGVTPTRTCSSYNRYVCRINKICNGDKKCEQEAAQYWLPNFIGVTYEEGAVILGESCNKEQQRCDSAKKNDYSCIKFKKNKISKK